MALKTKEITGSTNNSLWNFKIKVTENSNNEDNETSSVTVELILGKNSGTGNAYFDGTATLKFGAGGQTYQQSKTFSTTNISDGGFVSMGSHTFTIQHTQEPMTINVSGSFTTYEFTPTSASASGSMELTEIELGLLRIGVNDEYKKAKAYLGVNGVWKKCKAYLGVNGTWKKGK